VTLAPKISAIDCLFAIGLAAIAIINAGCAAAALPVAAQVAQGGIAAASMAGMKAGERSADRHTPGTLEDQEDRCDALVGKTPGVEEVRKNKQDLIESRQWHLVNAKDPHWMIVRTESGPGGDGWEPKPGIYKLQFDPPLLDQLDYKKSQFLAYAPSTVQTIDDSRAMTSVTEAFGNPTGTFQWRGKTYGYVLVSQLPCFPAEK
jgi:hypothetical protein